MARKQFLVIGAGRFGRGVALRLRELGHEVVVVDRDEHAIDTVINHVTHALVADVTDEAVIRKLGVNDFDHVIVAIGENLEANILATVSAKEAGAKHITSKAASDVAKRVLLRVGADDVIQPEHDTGVRLAMQLTTPSIVDAFNLGDRYSVVEVDVRHKLTGPLHRLNLTNRFGVQIIAVNRGGELTVTPSADFELAAGDMIVVVGENQAVERLREYLS